MTHRIARAALAGAALLALAAAPAGAGYSRIADPTGVLLGVNGGVVLGDPGTDGRPYELGLCNHNGAVAPGYYYVWGDPSARTGSGGTDTACSGDAPTVVTGPSSAVQPHSVTVAGTVKPNGVGTDYWFEYGPTAAYGSRTGMDYAGEGHAAQPASRPLGGLVPNTIYHYRLVAQSASGLTLGADRTLTTSS